MTNILNNFGTVSVIGTKALGVSNAGSTIDLAGQQIDMGTGNGIAMTLPLNSVVLNRSIMRPFSTVPRASYSRTASG